ncbi:serine/threonine protein phosphatase 2A 57 kDa regulatory subunit B iota isoform [Prunus yedoensis var. nudiflora]|uniref:Serine/threonine protein phosphatase 2A 57 kDa regulatory subunit B iota isoform n=1 Tax=Prunus yedoensis var. nudiflora TaxID=2094558 RepID=A0A314UIT7_PRUYE|nr:serine/threonine protein phosphatase 2A 57 kDa regulatory subunit B iota isoform [Prunus yedoensis var. nudiflora]
MLKQFLSKLPRKALKSDERPESPRTSTPRSSSRTGPSGVGGGAPRSNGGGNLGPGRSNGPKRMSSAVFPASVVAGG